MLRAILPLSRLLLVLAFALSSVPVSAQILLRDRVEIAPMLGGVQESAASLVTQGTYPTDDGIYYSVRVRPSGGFATCCQGHGDVHTTCHSPFSHGDALVFSGVGYDGTPFESSLGVLGALVQDTSYVSEAIYPLGYDLWPYPNCANGIDGGGGTVFYDTHARGVTLYDGAGEWTTVGDVEDAVTVGATYSGRSLVRGVYTDRYNYFGQTFWGLRLTSVPFGDYPPGHRALCGEGAFHGVRFDLDLEPRYKAVAFDVRVEPAELAPGEVATVTVTPVDSSGVPVGMPERDRVAVSAFDAVGAGLPGRGGGVVPLDDVTVGPYGGMNWTWPNYVSREGRVFGVLAPPDSLAPDGPEEVTVQAWGYSGSRNRHVVGETTLTLCPVGGCEAGGGMEVAVSPAVLRPGEEGEVSVEVTAAVPDLSDDDEVDLALSEVAADMGGLVVEGLGSAPVSALRVRLGDIRGGLVRYRVSAADEGGEPSDTSSAATPFAAATSAIRLDAVASGGETSNAAASLLPTPPSDVSDEGASGYRDVGGLPVVLSAALVRAPSVQGESEGVGVSPIAVSIEVGTDRLATNEAATVTAHVDLPDWMWQWTTDRWPDVGDAEQMWLQACVRHFEGAENPATGEVPIRRADFVGTQDDLASRDDKAHCYKLAEDTDDGAFDTLFDWVNDSGTYEATFKIPLDLPAEGFPPGHERDVLVHVGLVGVYDGVATFLEDRAGRRMAAGQMVQVRVPDPGLELEVLTPDDEWGISAVPAMPDVRVRARLFDAPNPQSTTTFSWEFDVSYTMRSTCGGDVGRDVTVTIGGKAEAVGSEWSEWSVPFHSDSVVTASFTGLNNGRGTTTECADEFASWSSVNGWTPLVPNASGTNPDYVEHNPNGDRSLSSPFVGTGLHTGRTTGRLFLGGNTEVRVSAESAGQAYEIGTPPTTPAILGTNPTALSIRTEIGRRTSQVLSSFERLSYQTGGFDVEREVTAMIAHESHRRQFRDELDHDDRLKDVCDDGQEVGYPCHNTSLAGYGLGQLDFVPPTEIQMWNWRYGVEGAATHYIKNRRKLVGDVEGRVDLTQPEVYVRDPEKGNGAISVSRFIFRGSYAKYNQGSQFDLWRFSGGSGVPVRTTQTSGPSRADSAWDRYLGLPASN